MTDRTSSGALDRRPGVTVWRQIADRIRADIPQIQAEHGGKLPSEADLALRFGVNRHTVRAAIAALAEQGLVRSERGRGTFAIAAPRFTYPIGRRTRFSAAFGTDGASARIELQQSTEIPADPSISRILCVGEGHPVLMLDTLGMVDNTILSFSTHWFDAQRFAALPSALHKSNSITQALRVCGVHDYTRKATTLVARTSSPHEAMRLDLSDSAILLVARATNVDESGKAFQYSETRFAADRVEIALDAADALAENG